MAITPEQVEYIARLAKLEFPEEERLRMAEEMNRILGYVEKLNELDTSDVTPLSHPNHATNVFREDRAEASLEVDDALQNAPEKYKGFFKVPKVI